MKLSREKILVGLFCLTALLAGSCTKGKKESKEALPADRLAQVSEAKLAVTSKPAPASAADPADSDKKLDDSIGGKDEKKKGKKKPGKASTWKRSTVVPNTSKLMIGDTEHLPLQGMQAYIQVDGFRARVALDCYFYNDRDRQYEGTFKLRLPTGASPYFFAFGKTAFKKAKDPRRGAW